MGPTNSNRLDCYSPWIMQMDLLLLLTESNHFPTLKKRNPTESTFQKCSITDSGFLSCFVNNLYMSKENFVSFGAPSNKSNPTRDPVAHNPRRERASEAVSPVSPIASMIPFRG
ncbi:uncharacterized protein [Physcomitrium patens]|uniref:uncharacterized protein isoform X2 n=1 Tax=Physcomitrium patens TaxID=3218 RepID=UPI003CCC98F5